MKTIGSLNETLARANTALSDIEVASSKVADSYRQRLVAGGELAEQEARAAMALADSAGAISNFSERTRELAAALEGARGGTEAFKLLEEEVKAVTEAFRTAVHSIAGASSSLAAAETTLAGHLANAGGTVGNLSAQVDALAAAQARLREFATTPVPPKAV